MCVCVGVRVCEYKRSIIENIKKLKELSKQREREKDWVVRKSKIIIIGFDAGYVLVDCFNTRIENRRVSTITG